MLGAQRPIDIVRLEGIRRPTLPPLPEDDIHAAILAHASTTPAVLIDPELAPVTLSEWLAAATQLEPGGLPHLVSWNLDHCEDLKSDIPGPSPELCATATALLDDERALQLVLAVALPAIMSDGNVRWLVQIPAIRKIRLTVQTPRPDSLDIPSLRDLDSWLQLPHAKWPMVDLKVSIEAKPPRALPGDLVTFVIQVANTGNRDADRAEIHAVLGQCCDTNDRRYDWFPTIPAGHTATVQFAEHLPDGRAIVQATATTYVPGGPAVADRNPEDNDASIWVHQVTDPPNLGPQPPD